MKQDKVVKSVVLEAENFLFRTVTGKCNFYSGLLPLSFVNFVSKEFRSLMKLYLQKNKTSLYMPKGFNKTNAQFCFPLI